jgi:hypothetical protein
MNGDGVGDLITEAEIFWADIIIAYRLSDCPPRERICFGLVERWTEQ